MKCDELNAYKADVTIPVYGTIADAEVYLKKDVDKVIAEKDKEIAELKADYKEACDRLQTANLIKDEQIAATRHQKYKRSLAMARWCERERVDAANYRIPREKWEFYDKWHKRWLELAEIFKPNNSTAQ